MDKPKVRGGTGERRIFPCKTRHPQKLGFKSPLSPTTAIINKLRLCYLASCLFCFELRPARFSSSKFSPQPLTREPIIIDKCFSPSFPLAAGKLFDPDSPFGHLMAELNATPSQVALACLAAIMDALPRTALWLLMKP